MEENKMEINELAKALSLLQSKLIGVKADSDNPFFKSKYASLDACWDSLRKPLFEAGLAVCQITVIENEKLYLRTILMHTSGQWISSLFPIIPKDHTAQALGSAMSYARRYSLAAITGLTQDDDDAERAMNRPPQKAYSGFKPSA